MDDEQRLTDEMIDEEPVLDASEPTDAEVPESTGGDALDDDDKDNFLLPGPTSRSNEGAIGWGVSWLIFSLLVMLFFLGMSFVCWVLARWVGWA